MDSRQPITYYAFALNDENKVGQLFVMRTNGRIQQRWTGVTYPSVLAACKDVEHLNHCV